MSNEPSKPWFKCGAEKPLSEFYKHPVMGDGHLNKCIECAKLDALKHRADNLERVRAYDRKRGDYPHRVAARAEYAKTEACRVAASKGRKNYRAKNPGRTRMYSEVSRSIKNGDIKKIPCERCGKTKNIHAHHEDYSKPLDVIWLCVKCHVERYKEMRRCQRRGLAIPVVGIQSGMFGQAQAMSIPF